MSQTADELIVIGRGRIITTGPVDSVIENTIADRVRVASPQASTLAQLLQQQGWQASPVEPSVLETTATDAIHVGELAAANGIVLHELTTIKASLEDAYLELTGDAVEYRAGAGAHLPQQPAANQNVYPAPQR